VSVRQRHLAIFAAVIAVAVFAVSSLAAQDVVEIRLRGRYFTDPATVRIVVAVEPDADNRALRIEADGDQLFRSSEVVLDGRAGKRIHTIEFKNLPSGNYTIRAAVLSTARVRGAAEEYLTVGDPGDQR
jgi:hypothetical protein